MTKASGIVLLAFLLCSCMESADPSVVAAYRPPPATPVEAPPEADRSFVAGEHVGGITPDMPMSLVENMYGSDRLESRKLPAGEGTTVPGYVLFPGDSDELFIELGDDKQPARARFSDPRSGWHDAATGLTIGTTLAELHEMNGRPFTFTGFGWDYGGTVSNWNGGHLENLLVRLTYAPERLPAAGLPEALLGDVPIASDADHIKGMGLRVREITVPIRLEE